MEVFLGVIKKYWIYVVLGIFAVNALILDLFVFFPKSQPLPTTNVAQYYCPQSCLNQIDLALKSQATGPSPAIKAISAQSPAPLASPSSRPTFTPIPSPTPATVKTVKEFFVPLGSGTGKSADWTVIDGMGAKIDPADYGDIKQITFELTAFVPTGNQQIWIRLYNANTYQAVAGSELTLSGGIATLLVSSPISLSSGNNLYQIQMKTQLQANTNIDMARIRIKTN